VSIFLTRLGLLSTRRAFLAAIASESIPTGTPDFTFIDRQSDVDAWQGAAFDGQFYYTTSYQYATDKQFWINKYDAQWTLVARRNLGPEAAGLHTQVNGLHYDATSGILYVCANNWPSTARGWVLELDPTDLSTTTYTELTGAKWTEAIFPHDGFWWEVNASGHEIRKFNTSFVLQDTYALPDTTPGGLFWQAIFVHNNVFYINLHEGASGTRLRIYTFTGSAFVHGTDVEVPPSADATQCVFFDNRFLYWSERNIAGGVGHLARTTVVDGLVLDGVPYLSGRDAEAYAGFTITARNGTAPYTYAIESGALPTGVTLHSTTGVVSGTPTVDGTFADIVLKVTDDTSAVMALPAFTMEIYPSSLADFNATVSASDIGSKLYGFPLAIDLAGMPAAFWTSVNADGGDIRAYGEHGTTELPLDVVVIDTGAETGFIVVHTDLSDVNSTIVRIALDGGGLRAASHALGRHSVWPSWRWEGVYAFAGDLLDRTANANDLTVRIGSVTYGTGTDGIGGGLDATSADLEVRNAALAGASDLIWPTTLMVSANRRTETTQNQFAALFCRQTPHSGNRKLGLGEQHATNKLTYFSDVGGWDDSAVGSTLNTDVIMVGNNIRGNEKFYVNGSLEVSPTGIPATVAADDTLTIGDAASASYWRGDIGMAYLAKEEHTADFVSAFSKMLKLNSTFVPVV